MTKEKSCGALVYYKNGDKLQILILKHKMGGQWSFPKGHIEKNETEIETALREVHEETGLTITLVGGFREMVSYFPRPGVSKDVVYFLGFTDAPATTMKEDEIGDIKWVDLSVCHKYLTYANDKQLLGKAKAKLKAIGVYGKTHYSK